MNYSQALEYLYGLRQFGLKLGLEGTRRLAALAGNPHDSLRFLHVAGTNGKGSTCAFLESICRAGGLKTGLYTSPHLVSFTERIQVDRVPISEAVTVSDVEWLKDLIEQSGLEHPPTFFEAVTVMALKHFTRAKCDIVIWETGLGGRLDATNIVTPLASILTPIGFDHQQWLGNTIASIAAEKAGIIKPNVPVFTSATHPDALEVFRSAARDASAPLFELAEGSEHACLGSFRPSLPGPHQLRNAALACLVARHFRGVLGITENSIGHGLSNASWPGRLQEVQWRGRSIWVDGAHNEDGARALRKALEAMPRQSGKGILLLGAMQDKEWLKVWQILEPLFDKTLLVPVRNERALHPARMLVEIARVDPSARVECVENLSDFLHHWPIPEFAVLTGSLYLAGEALEAMGALPVTSSGAEKSCSDWKPASRNG